LDYQQQIDLYKKYTELKKTSAKILETPAFNQKLGHLVETTTKHHQRLYQNQQQQATKSTVETSPMSNDRNTSTSQKSSQSQSTSNLAKDSPKHSSLFSLSKNSKAEKNRPVSHSPNKNNNDVNLIDSNSKLNEKPAKTRPKSNSLIKRISFRFKSLSTDMPDSDSENTAQSSPKVSKKNKRKDSKTSSKNSSSLELDKKGVNSNAAAPAKASSQILYSKYDDHNNNNGTAKNFTNEYHTYNEMPRRVGSQPAYVNAFEDNFVSSQADMGDLNPDSNRIL
jgi:hypothetical protein